MPGSSIASQLQAIRVALNVANEPEPSRRRPFTRPSILFDAKAAADIDFDTIFDLALSGLDVLISSEERFRNYKRDLFSHQSKELDRELLGLEENNRINASISSYLRLLSGYIELSSALKTLEYLIRRYKVHIFNKDDLILCALPYHDTHIFVRIVQLIDTGNSKWKFLDGVKSSGARLPREIIVQQCLRDMGVLEAICDYATPLRMTQPSKEVIGFCTGVVFEVLGIADVHSDMVKRILPYLSSVLRSSDRGFDQKAGAMMIISLLAQKSALSPNVAQSLLYRVADIARVGSSEDNDLQFVHMCIMTLITIVQLQNLKLIPKKTLSLLNEVRDFPAILANLDKKFNINKFLGVLVDSLLENSFSDDVHTRILLSLLETVPLKFYINQIVFRLLNLQLRLSQGNINSASAESGSTAKQILTHLCQIYPDESRRAFLSIMKDTKKSSYDVLCTILGEHFHVSDEVVDPKLLFALEHSDPEARRLAVSSMNTLNISRTKVAGSKKFDDIQDALVRRLYDEKLNVVLAVLSLDNLHDLINAPLLVEPIQHILHNCSEILISSSSNKTPLHAVALACLQQVVRRFKDQNGYAMKIAAAIFPLLLIRPKTRLSNVKALEFARELSWPFYENLTIPTVGKTLKGCLSSTNVDNVSKLGKSFSSNWAEYMHWLVECCKSHDLSKALFFVVLLQSLNEFKKDPDQFLLFFGSCFPYLKSEWEMLEAAGISAEQSKKSFLDRDGKGILEDLSNFKSKDLNYEILACLLFKLIEAFTEAMPGDDSLDLKSAWASSLEGAFLFITRQSKNIFEKHRDLLLLKCKAPLTHLMLNMLSVEGASDASQIESLHFLAHISSQLDDIHANQLLSDFPVVLVPLSSDNQNVRAAAMSYIEALYAFCSCIRSGKVVAHLQWLGEVMSLVIEQKKMILSDTNVLCSLLTSVLSSSSDSLLVQKAFEKRFDDFTKDEMLHFILNRAHGLPAHSKLRILCLIKGVGSKLISIPVLRAMLQDLLELCNQHSTKLLQSDIEILCLLLECCCSPSSSHELHGFEDFIIKALQIRNAADSAGLEPCLRVLKNLTSSMFSAMKNETQEIIFFNLLVLFRNTRGDVQSSARDALLRIDFDCSIVGRVLDSILSHETHIEKKKKKKSAKQLIRVTIQNEENTLTVLSSLLDVLLMKKNMENRPSLFGPLFKLFRMIKTSDVLMPKATDKDETLSCNSPQAIADTVTYIQQALLLVLENITASMDVDPIPKDMIQNFDFPLVLSFARASNDLGVRNHIFSLIATVVKIMPDLVFDQMIDILAAIGEYATEQWDNNSQQIFEGLISAILPCWLSRNDDADQLFQIFVKMLANVSEHRRVFISVHILRILGEADSLGSLLFYLFHWMISRIDLFSGRSGDQFLAHTTLLAKKQWEYDFAVQLCGNYSCSIWLPSIIILLKKIGSCTLNEDSFKQMFATMVFIADKLQDPEISRKLKSKDDLNDIQVMIGELMEQVVCHQQLVESAKKRLGIPSIIKSEMKTFIRDVLRTLMNVLPISTYLEVIIKLIGNDNKDVRNKALQLFCETMKDLGTDKKFEKKNSLSRLKTSWLRLDENCLGLVEKLCLETLILFESPDEVSSSSTKLAALSVLEVAAERFPSQDRVFTTCLGSVCKGISSDNVATSSHCLLTAAALVNALGLSALPELPNVMKCVLKMSNSGEHVFASILQTLVAITEKLAGFLNPYLGDILKLVVLHPLALSLEPKLKAKADALRACITERIPARLLLPPLLLTYTEAVSSGDYSVSTVFVMLKKLVSSLDRPSVAAYHAKIFDLCLLALGLRTQDCDSIRNIDAVEENIIGAFVTLTMKLTESMFRPLFIKTVEWSTSESAEFEASRAVSFYKLINKLAEDHRSLFVPYFKYLIDGCVKGLVTDEMESGVSQKKRKKVDKKKKKNSTSKGDELSPLVWRLRASIMEALHKCFLYDTASPRFLDSSKFQVLLQPLVSQLVVEPPPDCVENDPNVPSVKDVDDLVVSCIGQMAVAADSDLLWKPLNHEVLMQTRSEKVRARILGVRVVKFLVDNLRDGYMAFLPETIPFLGELLEDGEDTVKNLAQQVIIEMETITGESLKDYL